MKNIILTDILLMDSNLNSTQTIVLATIQTYMNNDILLMSNDELSNALNNKFKTNTIKKVVYQLKNMGYINTKNYTLTEPKYDLYGNARVITLVNNDAEPVTEEEQKIIDFVGKLKKVYVQNKIFNQALEYCDDEYNNLNKRINYKLYSEAINRFYHRFDKL